MATPSRSPTCAAKPAKADLKEKQAKPEEAKPQPKAEGKAKAKPKARSHLAEATAQIDDNIPF